MTWDNVEDNLEIMKDNLELMEDHLGLMEDGLGLMEDDLCLVEYDPGHMEDDLVHIEDNLGLMEHDLGLMKDYLRLMVYSRPFEALDHIDQLLYRSCTCFLGLEDDRKAFSNLKLGDFCTVLSLFYDHPVYLLRDTCKLVNDE